MPRSRFEELSPAVLAAVAAGSSVADAARSSGVGTRTVARWLAQGREEHEGQYGPFAQAVDGCRAGRQLPTPEELDELDEDELRRVVARCARRGNVQAARFYYDVWIKNATEEVRPDASDPLAEADELARRRLSRR